MPTPPSHAPPNPPSHDVIEAVYRAESRRVLATLIRLLGDFDLAEEALHDAFASAVEQWPLQGTPANPRAWLVSVGRFKAIDALRRRESFDKSLPTLAETINTQTSDDPHPDERTIEDDQLRLIFTCCHPALSPEARLALTLREVCGLTTEEIARAFFAEPPTIAQRIVRAKNKIKSAGIPYQVPPLPDLPERLETVLHVIYLLFNEGYAATAGDSLTRPGLTAEAIRLGRLLSQLLPEPEALGLLALMLLQESRRDARAAADGRLIPLDEQDRARWNQQQISEGVKLVERSLLTRRLGPYTLQAAIAAVHAQAKMPADTDWPQIVALYGLLLRINTTPIVELNRAVAVAMSQGPDIGLSLIDAILARGELRDYHLAHAARAELCRRLNRTADARLAYQTAIELALQDPERQFLERRLRDLT